jgi:adenylate kinase family enzyme
VFFVVADGFLMKISFIGMSGAGKSSIARLITERYDIPYLSMGATVRDILLRTNNSELENEIRDILKYTHWCPLSDQAAIKLFLSITEGHSSFIIDGFPRSLTQYDATAQQLEKVVYFDVDSQTSMSRVMRRRRECDNMNNWSARQIFDNDRYPPLIDQLKVDKKLHIINADECKSTVYSQVISKIGLKQS